MKKNRTTELVIRKLNIARLRQIIAEGRVKGDSVNGLERILDYELERLRQVEAKKELK